MLPKISVLTPSFNQAQFLEQTIQSVIGQGYPNLEYIVMDGGSQDGSVEIIKKYEKHLSSWQSAPDGGQANAINKGFAIATGDILCWLNSDDMYLPGTLFQVATQLMNKTTPTLIFGNCLHFSEGNPEKVRGSNVVRDHKELDLSLVDYIIQPSSFWNRSAFELVGPMNEGYHFVFDWDWFLRARDKGVEFFPDSKFLSVYRIHRAHKTGTGGDQRMKELDLIHQEYGSTNEINAIKRYRKITKGLDGSRIGTKILSMERLLYALFFRTLVSARQFRSIRNVH